MLEIGKQILPRESNFGLLKRREAITLRKVEEEYLFSLSSVLYKLSKI